MSDKPTLWRQSYRAAEDVKAELKSRKGLRQAFDETDRDTEDELTHDIAQKIRLRILDMGLNDD